MNKARLAYLLVILVEIILLPVSRADNAAPARSGEEVFQKSCSTCHATNFPGAPQVHDTAAWQKKYAVSQTQALQQDPSLKSKDLDAKTWEILIAKVRNGNKAMVPKGLCNDCTDQEYQNAIEFMMKAK